MAKTETLTIDYSHTVKLAKTTFLSSSDFDISCKVAITLKVGTLNKLKSQPASTLLGNVKKPVTTVDGLLDVGSNVGNPLSAGSAL